MEYHPSNIDFNGVQNIIFDLGGVIIDIDFQLTYNAFERLSSKNLEEVHHIFQEQEIYDKYERGLLSNEEFRSLVTEHMELDHSDEEIDKAWNALLLELPKERVDRIFELKNKYNLYLLSNTSGIHIDEVNKILHQSTGVPNLNEMFEKVYYSYEMGMRKPDLEIYESVMDRSSLNRADTVFVDDNYDNIVGADSAGIQVIHLKDMDILEAFKDA